MWMNGWMNEWMNEWMDEWMSGWTDEIYEWPNKRNIVKWIEIKWNKMT